MELYDYDFSSTEDYGGGERSKTVPEGKYEANIVKVERKMGGKGAYYSLDFVIQNTEHKGRHVFDIFSTSPNSAGRMKMLLKAVGVDVTGRVQYDFNDMPGSRVEIVVGEKEEEYNGKTTLKNRVSFVNTSKEGGGQDGFSEFEDDDDE